MHSASRQSGRISFVLVAGLCSLALVLAIILYRDRSPRTIAAEFLSALSSADVDKLAKVSRIHELPEAEVKKAWQDTLNYARTFTFYWELKAVSQHEKTAYVKVDFTKDPRSELSYPEHKELVLVETPEGWKVDVPQIPRDMFPYLPK